MSEIIFLISSFLGSKPNARIATLSSFASIVPRKRGCTTKRWWHCIDQVKLVQDSDCVVDIIYSKRSSMQEKPGERLSYSCNMGFTWAIRIEKIERLPYFLLLLLSQLKLFALLVPALCTRFLVVSLRNTVGMSVELRGLKYLHGKKDPKRPRRLGRFRVDCAKENSALE